MTITTLTSTAFYQDAAGVRNATIYGPVIITVHGNPAYAFMSFDEYRRLRDGKKMSLLDSLSPGHATPLDDDFDFPKLAGITNQLEIE